MGEEENKLRPGNWGSAAQLLAALDGIGNGEGVLTHEEDNTLRPGDGGSADQLFPALDRIGNGERKFLPSKPKKRIPPKKKKKFGRTKTGNNKNSPVSQVNTTNASNVVKLTCRLY